MSPIENGPWATGIGSLPFVGDEALEQALALEARLAREIPFEFELPRLLPDDALLRRPFAGLLEPGAMDEARLTKGAPEALEGSGAIGTTLREFVARVLTGQERWAKFQLAGPQTIGKYVLGKNGKPLGSTSEGREFVMSVVTKLVASILECLRSKSPETTPVIFLDEPGLARDVTELANAVELARGAGALVGVHDCGTDFRNALQARPDILSFDFASFGSHVGESWDPIGEFVKAGGSLAWGAVSTAPTAKRFDPSITAGAIRTAALRLTGSDKGARELLQRSLITPACGTALLEPEHAVSLHARAIQVAELLRMKTT